MTNINDIYKSGGTHLKAEDLKGQEIEATIAGHKVAKLKDDEPPKVILAFRNSDKTLALNKTNAAVIAVAYGAEVEGWYNKPIILYPTVTDFGGKTVPCIRVRVPMPSSSLGQSAKDDAVDVIRGPATEAPAFDDDIPF